MLKDYGIVLKPAHTPAWGFNEARLICDAPLAKPTQFVKTTEDAPLEAEHGPRSIPSCVFLRALVFTV